MTFMKYISFILLFVLMLPVAAFAHDTGNPDYPHAHAIPAAIEHNIVNITHDGTYRYIEANGIPNHDTGQFPNRNNPNSISAQNYHYRVPLQPEYTGYARPKTGVIGVALNGIPFDPATAECYGKPRGQGGGPAGSCEWREEAIVDGEGQLGLDGNNAHVQPNGAYHYHGMPNGLLEALPHDADLVQVGFAADGFPIMVSYSGKYRSSYRLKKGYRPDGPGGEFDGTYTQDYEYAMGAGRLDQCNGANIDGVYMYFITNEFPYVPRCLKGVADPSFDRHAMMPPNGRDRGGFDDGRRPPPPLGGRRPPF